MNDQQRMLEYMKSDAARKLHEARTELRELREQVASGDTVPRAEYERLVADRDHWRNQCNEASDALGEIYAICRSHYGDVW